jgi:UDP-N-acetylmuramate-alanine ligase
MEYLESEFSQLTPATHAPYQACHFVGIGGAGMSGIAEVLATWASK